MERINMIDIKRELAEIGEELKASISRSFQDTMFINGPRVKEFEKKAAEFLGVKHAIGCANGTDAILLALLSLGIKPGDEVITTPFTFFATAEVCSCIGAKPVFVDIDDTTLDIDASKIEAAITDKTKAIVPVHIFGSPCDMKSIMDIAGKHDLKVMEDCAQSFGASIGGKMTGSISNAGSISFYPTKNLGAYGDAGMVVTNDDETAELCRKYREHGSSVRYHHDLIGYNSRLDDIQAAILSVKIEYIDKYNALRRAAASKYKDILKDSVAYQGAYDGAYHIYHQFTIRCKNRDEVMKKLDENGIASAIFYPIPCHLQKSMEYLGYKKGDLPVCEKASDEVLSLPMNPYLRDDEIERIADVVKAAAKLD